MVFCVTLFDCLLLDKTLQIYFIPMWPKISSSHYIWLSDRSLADNFIFPFPKTSMVIQYSGYGGYIWFNIMDIGHIIIFRFFVSIIFKLIDENTLNIIETRTKYFLNVLLNNVFLFGLCHICDINLCMESCVFIIIIIIIIIII